MERIFLSYHFDDEGRALADLVERMIFSHGIKPESGRRLAGESLSQEIKKRIARCDGLVCLLTEREAGQTNQWVHDERGYAEGLGKRVIALVDERVDVGGMFSDRERLQYDRKNPLPALIRLSETIGDWRSQGGRIVPLQLEPDDAAEVARSGGEFVKIKYRFWARDDATEWREARAVPTPGGVLIYLKGVLDDVRIEICMEDQNTKWRSKVQSQMLRAPMQQVQS